MSSNKCWSQENLLTTQSIQSVVVDANMKRECIQKIIVHGLLDKTLNKESASCWTHTLRKCCIHGARKEARPNTALHITKSCQTHNNIVGCYKCNRYGARLLNEYMNMQLNLWIALKEHKLPNVWWDPPFICTILMMHIGLLSQYKACVLCECMWWKTHFAWTRAQCPPTKTLGAQYGYYDLKLE